MATYAQTSGAPNVAGSNKGPVRPAKPSAPPRQQAVGHASGPPRVAFGHGNQLPKAPPGQHYIGTGKGRWVLSPKAKGAAPKPPDWLAPQTNQALTKQATNTIKQSYAPTFSDLNSQQSRLDAINSKRQSDDKYFQGWLATQGANLMNQQQQYNQQVLGTALQAGAGLADVLHNQVGDITQGQTGVNQQQIQAGLQHELAPAQQNAAQTFMNSTAQQSGQIAAINNALGATALNNQGILQSNRGKALADYQTQSAALAQQRSKAGLAEKGDITKEITRLQGVEIQKAQSTRSYNAAIQKLGVQSAIAQGHDATSTANNQRTNATSASNNRRSNLTRAQQDAANRANARAIAQGHDSTSRANNAANNATRQRGQNLTAGNAAGAPNKQGRYTATQLHKARTSVRNMINHYKDLGFNDQQARNKAYEALRTGRQDYFTYDPGDKQYKHPKWSKGSGPSLPNDGLLSWAWHTEVQGSPSAGDTNWITSQGYPKSFRTVRQP